MIHDVLDKDMHTDICVIKKPIPLDCTSEPPISRIWRMESDKTELTNANCCDTQDRKKWQETNCCICSGLYYCKNKDRHTGECSWPFMMTEGSSVTLKVLHNHGGIFLMECWFRLEIPSLSRSSVSLMHIFYLHRLTYRPPVLYYR